MEQHGHFCWNELMTRDVERAKAFYGETVGWTFEAMDMGENGTYWIGKDGDQPVSGMFDAGGSDFEAMAPCWFSYLAVDDVDARVEKATKAGASVQQAPFNIPGIGRIAIIQEPTGAVQGWMTPATP